MTKTQLDQIKQKRGPETKLHGKPLYLDPVIRLLEERAKLLEAMTEIRKLWCCPPPKTLKDWSARCDVMADHARSAIAFAESE